jgi:hemoglobin
MTIPIADRMSVKILVDLFYHKVRQDDLLAPVFQHVDWEGHLPIMYNFWCSLLLGDRSYQGSPFDKHLSLKLQSNHFERWLQLFEATVDENFTGDNASEGKQRARQIATVWQAKLGLLT